MHPRADRVRRIDDRCQRVHGPAVHVAGLGEDDGRAGRPGEHLFGGVGADRPLAVHGDAFDRVAAETHEAQRLQRGGMDLVAGEDPDRGRADQPARLDVPAGPREHGVAGRREPDHVRGRRSGREPAADVRRQTEDLAHPPAGDLLDHRGGRAGDVRERVLIPGAGQPVGGQRGRQRSADHEPEVARPGRRDEARVGAGQQRVDHRLRVLPAVREWSIPERLPKPVRRDRPADRPFGHAVEVVDRAFGGMAQQVGGVGHGGRLPSRTG